MAQSAAEGEKALIDSIDGRALWSSTIYILCGANDGSVKCHTSHSSRSTNEGLKLVHLQLRSRSLRFKVRISTDFGGLIYTGLNVTQNDEET